MSRSSTIPKILYVDDDSDDCIFLSESFAANASCTDLVYAPGGEEAIRYLDAMDDEGLPSLIILDLNMPRWDGRQTLNYIKSNPHYSAIPVVVLSTSESKIDKEVCARLGAATYLQKPYQYEGYKTIVQSCIPYLVHG